LRAANQRTLGSAQLVISATRELQNENNKEDISMANPAPAARTPGAKRAGPGEHAFELAKINRIKVGPAYSTAEGACIEGDRMIVALMRMPAGTGAEPHSHPNEQWIYILEGTFRANIGGKEIEAKPGTVLYVPSNTVHGGKATPDADVVFFTCKDASHSLHGIKAA
jgi:quercetin dioxygenase-like cupin family protein